MNEREYHDHHYEAEAARIRGSALFERVHERTVRDFLRRTGCGRGQRILSLGCGDGSIERRLAPHVGEIVGLDISPVAIAQARSRGSSFSNLSFALSEPGGSLERHGEFDVIAAFAFLHHLDEAGIGEALRAARKALRPGGVFYSTDPSRRRLIGIFRPLVRKTYERYHSPDERELDPRALAALVARAGFHRPRIGYTDYFLGPLAWLAPGTPGWLSAPLEMLDNLALSMPLLRRYASSFCVCACSTSSSPR